MSNKVVMDFPTTFAYIRDHWPCIDDHDPRCSYAVSEGSFLCDCECLYDEYSRREFELRLLEMG